MLTKEALNKLNEIASRTDEMARDTDRNDILWLIQVIKETQEVQANFERRMAVLRGALKEVL